MSDNFRARVEFDASHWGVRVALAKVDGEYNHVVQWPEMLIAKTQHAAEATTSWLRLQDGEARALYEALAEHFGHTTNDVRALRQDYEAERKRVDRLIDVLVRPTVVLDKR